MSFIFKKKKEVETKSCNDLSKAKNVSEKYNQLSKCCEAISQIESEDNDLIDLYHHGWKVSGYSIKASGIDINLIYDYIKTLAIIRKKEIETELTSL